MNGTKSTNIAFTTDKKSAVVTFSAAFIVGDEYTISLVDDASNLFAATELVTITTIVLPSVDDGNIVTPDEDEIRMFTIKFAKSMGTDALTRANYKILDLNNNVIAVSAATELNKDDDTDNDFAWDTTTDIARTQLDFYVKQGRLEAGKTYKLIANQDIKALDGTAIKKNEIVATFTTPSLDVVKPEVALTRIASDNTAEIYFDKNVEDVTAAAPYISALKENGIDITSKIASTTEVKDNVLTITLSGSNKFVENKSYTVSLNSRLAVSKDYKNAYNDPITDLKIEAVKNEKPVLTSVAIVRDGTEKEQANLKFVFDKPVKPANVVAGNIVIETMGDSYSSVAGPNSLALDTTDASNKTLILKDIADGTKFGANFNASALKETENYKITLEAGVVEVNTLDTPAETNAKTAFTVKGIDVAAPVAKSLTLVSDKELQIKFDKAIDASDLKASDIEVNGFYKAYGNRYYAAKTLSGDDFLTFTVAGDTITIKPKDTERTVFQTGKVATNNVVEIAANKIKDSNGIKLSTIVDDSAVTEVVDKVAPKMIFAESTTTDEEVKITFTENILPASGTDLASQFIIAGAKGNDGSAGASNVDIGANSNTITITFNSGSVDKDTEYKDATIQYVRESTKKITDTATPANDAQLQTITGISK